MMIIPNPFWMNMGGPTCQFFETFRSTNYEQLVKNNRTATNWKFSVIGFRLIDTLSVDLDEVRNKALSLPSRLTSSEGL
jgi:hypothetical protein